MTNNARKIKLGDNDVHFISMELKINIFRCVISLNGEMRHNI